MEIGQALGGYKVAKELGIVDWLISKFKKPRPIIVIGSTGVGKTQFSLSLVSPLQNRILQQDRTTSFFGRKLKLGEKFIELVDTPGHTAFEEQSEAALKRYKKNCKLIVFLVANGYHENETPAGTVFNGDHVDQAYLESNREKEFTLLKQLIHKVRLLDFNCTILILVNKFDLWHEEWGSVHSNYLDKVSSLANGKVKIGQILPYIAHSGQFYGKDVGTRVDDVTRKEQHNRVTIFLEERC